MRGTPSLVIDTQAALDFLPFGRDRKGVSGRLFRVSPPHRHALGHSEPGVGGIPDASFCRVVRTAAVDDMHNIGHHGTGRATRRNEQHYSGDRTMC
jgi:hypothetical protein